jgi:hypothetical protein
VSAIAVSAVVLVAITLFLAGSILLALFVRQAAIALLALRELREQTIETDERRATVSAAQAAVEDMRRGSFGNSADVDMDLLHAVHAEAAANGRPYRVDDNERRNHGEEEEEPPEVPEGFYVPAEQQ